MTDNAAARTAEYSKRKKANEERTFRKDEQEFAESNGWTLIRENKDTLRYEKPRSIDEKLENEFWRLLYELGYPSLNVGRKFKITVSVKDEGSVLKQIDVFAYDDQTVIVTECKACEKRTKRQLQKDIGEFASLQKPIAIALKKHFGGANDRKIIWMFVTKNVDWSQPDLIRASDNNIKVITERELPYFKEIAKRIGRSARFQFHAEFLAKQKVASLEKNTFAMRTKLGKHRVYTFFTSPDKILPISFVNHRDLRDPSAAPSYQRLVQRDRLKHIADFVTAGGLFPNSIILNFRTKVRFDPLAAEEDGVTPGKITLPNTYKSAWIIDGQHRLYGYAEMESKQNGAMLPFIAFENISIIDETKLFSEINSKQKRVEKRLLDELTGEIKLESTDKKEQMRAIASRVFDLMRDDEDCPLGGKITGVELKSSDQSVLTIPYLVDAVVRANLIGSVVKKDTILTFIQGSIEWSSAQIAIDRLREFLAEYLGLFKAANPARWDMGPAGKIANNPSISGIIRFSQDIIRYVAHVGGHDPRHLHPKELVEILEPYLAPVLEFIGSGDETEVTARFSVPFGSGGPARIQHLLRVLTFEKFQDFDAPDFKERLRQNDQARVDRGDKLVRRIQEGTHSHVVQVLKGVYGAQTNFLELAVDNQDLLTNTFKKRLDDKPENRKELATYLDFLDLKKIVGVEKNWGHFKDTLDFVMPGEKKQSKNLAWFESINKTRRIPAHPYDRSYSDDDMKALEAVFAMLTERKLVVETD